jgi:outer membrane receptor protein involved in Fe transport
MRKPAYTGAATLAQIAAFLAAAPALAQETTGTAESGAEAGDVIIVTANKREQPIVDVPLSITALSNEAIRASGADTIEDIQFRIPGLSLVNFGPGTGNQVQLRGVSASSGLPTVGIYLDEMPVGLDSNNTNLDLDLSDLERVEVLRGPQGTLYGEGSMGGTIKYGTAAPDLFDVEGSVSGEFALVERGKPNWRTRGILSLPVVEGKLAVRGLVSYSETGGWIDQGGARDANTSSRLSARAGVLFAPSEETKIRLLYAHGETEADNDDQSQSGRISTGTLSRPGSSNYDLANLTLAQDVGGIQILSSTGFLTVDTSNVLDLTNSFVPFLEAPPPFGFGFPPGSFTGVGAATMSKSKIWTQELRLSNNTKGSLDWTIGAYYRDSRVDSGSDSFSQPFNLPFELFSSNIQSGSKAWAVFGQATYALMPSLDVTLGARYYRDKRKQDATSTSFGFPSSETSADTFSSFNPRASILYKFSESSSIYASVAKGFRSGGFNLQSTGGGNPVPPTFDPETLWTYEVGGFLGADNNRFTVQWAVYYNDWSDIQSLSFLPGSPLTAIVNGGAASGLGVDFQANYRPSREFDMGLAIGWNNMKYDKATADHAAGDPLDFVSPFNISANATVSPNAFSDFGGNFAASVQYTKGFDVNIRNFLPAPASSESRVLVRLSAGINVSDWNAQLYVDNLLNEDKIVMPAYGALAQPYRTYPRTFGLSIERSF